MNNLNCVSCSSLLSNCKYCTNINTCTSCLLKNYALNNIDANNIGCVTCNSISNCVTCQDSQCSACATGFILQYQINKSYKICTAAAKSY